MRVISGSAKGRKLKAPPGLDTRPITDMIKGALFNIWGSKVAGSKLLDLFAGSGSVGIEALSRGAEKVFFVDKSNQAVRVIKENLSHCGFEKVGHVYHGDIFQALGVLARQGELFDLIYIDPPFTNSQIFSEVMELLDRTDIYGENADIVLRTPRKMEMPSFIRLKKYRHKSYGESSLHYYCRQEEDPKDDGNISYTG